jgi:hypothetical protein
MSQNLDLAIKNSFLSPILIIRKIIIDFLKYFKTFINDEKYITLFRYLQLLLYTDLEKKKKFYLCTYTVHRTIESKKS